MLPSKYASPNTKFSLSEYASKSQIASIFVFLVVSFEYNFLYLSESHRKTSVDFHWFLRLSNSCSGICFIGDAVTIDEKALNSFNRAFSSEERISLSGSNKTV